MTKPVFNVTTDRGLTRQMEVSTLMIHNEDPPMVVMVTAVDGETAGDFAGVDLETGIYTNTYQKAEFTFFDGTLTLTQ